MNDNNRTGALKRGFSNPSATTIIFLGDICLNDDYNTFWKKDLKPFASLEGLLTQADLVVGNLECLARGDQGTNPLRPYALTAEPETLGYLKDISMGLACLANNHIYDNLDSGFSKTLDILKAAGIAHAGASLEGREGEPFIFSSGGLEIGILNYVTRDTNPQRPVGARAGLNWFTLDKAKDDIRKLRETVDQVVIFPHWGGRMEGSLYPEPALRELAHQLVDLGADLIVGHHSHTLQPFEIYRGKHIYYSLGNFCFSDVYKDGVKSESDHARTRRSMLLRVDFRSGGYAVRHVGLVNEGRRIRPLTEGELKLRDLSGKRPLLYRQPIWSLYYFYEKNLYKIFRYFFANGRDPLKQLFRIKPDQVLKVTRNFILTFKSQNCNNSGGNERAGH